MGMVPMESVLRIIIVNGDEEYSAAIRTELHRLPGVQIVAEVDELAMIEQAVKQFPARVLFFNLDPDPSTSLPVAVKIAANNNNLAVIVLSECQDPQLIMTAYRSGIRDFLTKPIDRKEITLAIADVARPIDDGHAA